HRWGAAVGAFADLADDGRGDRVDAECGGCAHLRDRLWVGGVVAVDGVAALWGGGAAAADRAGGAVDLAVEPGDRGASGAVGGAGVRRGGGAAAVFAVGGAVAAHRGVPGPLGWVF